MTDKFPEMIYLVLDEDYDFGYPGSIAWCQDRINDADVKYIRADTVKEGRSGMKAEIVKFLNTRSNRLKEGGNVPEFIWQTILDDAELIDKEF